MQKSDGKKVYSLETCNAKVLAGDLVRCMSSEQGSVCAFSLPFGAGYLCKHPQRAEIVANTKMSPDDLPATDNDNP